MVGCMVESAEYFWGSNGWSEGDLALNGRGETKVYSFDVVDQLLAILADRTDFPALETVAVIRQADNSLIDTHRLRT